jgi:hypothetical protein
MKKALSRILKKPHSVRSHNSLTPTNVTTLTIRSSDSGQIKFVRRHFPVRGVRGKSEIFGSLDRPAVNPDPRVKSASIVPLTASVRLIRRKLVIPLRSCSIFGNPKSPLQTMSELIRAKGIPLIRRKSATPCPIWLIVEISG